MENSDSKNGFSCADSHHWDSLDLNDESKCYAKILGIPSASTDAGWNDSIDAFRHAYAAAVMARDHGAAASKALFVAHEVVGVVTGGSVDESKMDLLNNEVGLAIADKLDIDATDDEVASMVAAALKSGNLITSPADTLMSKLEMDEMTPVEKLIILTRIIENISYPSEATTSSEQQSLNER